MKIPYQNLNKLNRAIIKSIWNNINEVLDFKSEFDHHRYVSCFEENFAEYNGSKHALAVNSGTTALELALKGCGIGEGDEVILPSYTYIASALAVTNLNAVPVFVDIKKKMLTISPDEIEKNITKKTKAIVAVHIHGNPCEMDRICQIALQNNLKLIEDCSHAHGAEYKKIKVGNFGIGCFSCYSSKFFSGLGNSGILTSNNDQLHQYLKELIYVKNDPNLELLSRTPCKMDAIQAAILNAKLPYLNSIIQRQRTLAGIYFHGLTNFLKFQTEEPLSKHVYRELPVYFSSRDKVKKLLEKNGIETRIRYPIPLHMTNYYKQHPSRISNLSVTEEIYDQILCLPTAAHISRMQVNDIIKLLTKKSG